MPRPSSQNIAPAADQAAWLEGADATRSPRLDPAHPAFRPFRDAGFHLLGQDILKEKFHAGTPCSPTHLLWIVTRGSVTVDFGPMVTRIRMDRAMELLLATDRKLDDIAAVVGYATAHAFSAAFLSHVGRRPGSFRGKDHLTTTETSP